MTTASCSLHAEHQPANLTVEDHHVIPQAWQRFWTPPGHPGGLKEGLWDPRTVPICPSGHRNVHFLIVEAMKALAGRGVEDGATVTAVLDAVALAHHHGHRGERDTAALALNRFQQAGGSLLALAGAGEWGEA